MATAGVIAYLYKKGCEVSKKEEGYNGAEVDLSKERKKEIIYGEEVIWRDKEPCNRNKRKEVKS